MGILLGINAMVDEIIQLDEQRTRMARNHVNPTEIDKITQRIDKLRKELGVIEGEARYDRPIHFTPTSAMKRANESERRNGSCHNPKKAAHGF